MPRTRAGVAYYDFRRRSNPARDSSANMTELEPRRGGGNEQKPSMYQYLKNMILKPNLQIRLSTTKFSKNEVSFFRRKKKEIFISEY